MNVNRRDLLRQLAGLGTAGALWVSARYVLGAETPDSPNDISENPLAARNLTSDETTIVSPKGSTAPTSIVSDHEHHGSTNSNPGSPSSTAKSTDGTENDPVATTAGTADEQVTTSVGPGASVELEGNVGPVLIPAGSTVKIVGDINLKGDLIVEGVLTGVDAFTLEGNGHQILVQRGGRLDLAGREKTGWAHWGDPVTGWKTGDRLAIAPTAAGVYEPISTTWKGSWAATKRPGSAPDINLMDGRKARPEVANLSQTVRLQNLARVMFHDGAGIQSLRWLRVVDCGVGGKLGFYPIHFHLNGNSSHGSLVEGVVVEGGKFRSFVPHGSHGITMRDCVAYRSHDTAFWWDAPPDADKRSALNNSNDTTWKRCLVLQVISDGVVTSGFQLGAGSGNRCIDSVASCVGGKKNASGFYWTGNASQNKGGNVWGFTNNVVHNNRNNGVYIWQNDGNQHAINDLTIYNCGRIGFEHGAYQNNYQMKRMLIQRAGVDAVGLHAIGGIRYTDVLSDGPLKIHAHSIANPTWVEFTRCNFTGVEYSTAENQEQPSSLLFTDCGLKPDDFIMGGIHPASLIQIVEKGVVTASWADGSWS